MKISNFKLLEVIGETRITRKYRASIDVTSGVFKRTKTVEIYKKHDDSWYFVDTGQFTPFGLIEILVRKFEAANDKTLWEYRDQIMPKTEYGKNSADEIEDQATARLVEGLSKYYQAHGYDVLGPAVLDWGQTIKLRMAKDNRFYALPVRELYYDTDSAGEITTVHGKLNIEDKGFYKKTILPWLSTHTD